MNETDHDDWKNVVKTQPVNRSETDSAGSAIVCLKGHKEILVHQLLDVVEVLLGWQRINRYQVLDNDGNQLLYIYEVADCYSKQCLGGLREFSMKLSDDNGVDLLSVYRPLRCTSRCCWACSNLQELHIKDSFGTKIATVYEIWSFFMPKYKILDQSDNLLYMMVGECCYCRCCSKAVFKVQSPSGEDVCTITKLWTGCREVIGAANDFTLEYDDKLNDVEKTIILGSAFLLDCNYFQRHNRCWF